MCVPLAARCESPASDSLPASFVENVSYRYAALDGCTVSLHRSPMSRPPASLDQFSFSELAQVGDISKRAVQLLSEAVPSLLPEGKGIEVLKRIAVIGGFVSGGVPLLAAGRIASVLVEEFNEIDGEIPSHLGELARHLPPSLRAEMPALTESDFWFHVGLWRSPMTYVPGRSLPNDVLIVIADREHVFIRYPMRTSAKGVDKDNRILSLGYVDGWDRGTVPRVVREDEANRHNDYDEPYFEVAKRALENPVALLTVNCSLAIRTGLDRLAMHREEARVQP
jgi:hypothetical protein